MIGLAFLGFTQLVTALVTRGDGNLPVRHDAGIHVEEYPKFSQRVAGASPAPRHDAEDVESYLPSTNARDLTHLSRLIEARMKESPNFDPDQVISEWAAEIGINLDDEQMGSQAPPSTIEPPAAAVDRRADPNSWAERARKSGEAAYRSSWQQWVAVLGRATDTVAITQQAQLCPRLTGSAVDGCKRGVRAQVAYCKQALRDNIAKCKDDVRRWVDKCKKRDKWIPGGSAACELQRPGKMAECEGRRVNIPLCEVDRLSATCCEGTRSQLQGMCAAGVSPARLQAQIQKVQAACAIATALAKSAIKTYLSGQALGILNDVQSIKQLGQTVQVVKKLQATRGEYKKWADGLTAAAEGRLAEAQKALGSLASQISPSISNAVAWAAAAEAAVTRNVDGFLANASKAAGEIAQIKIAKDSIDALKSVANDIKVIQAQANECAKVPLSITPNEYPGWNSVSSWETLNAAVNEYKKAYTQTLFAAAKCRAVVVRASRLVLS